MKKRLVLMLLLATCWSGVFGQSSSKEVIYGTVRSDGYQKITTGAFWSERPEAKIIYEGGNTPSGYAVFVLEKDYYVRFVDTEHNNLDRNYIVFPKGEKVYANNISGYFYSAKCGNRIESLQPVDRVKIVEKTVLVKDTTPTSTSSFVSSFNNISYSTTNYYQPQPKIEVDNPKHENNWWEPIIFIAKVAGVTVGVGGVGYLFYSLLKKEDRGDSHHNRTNRDNPGGSPVTPPVVDPGGGPGGAPPTR
jgi:hypothetical protein